MPEASIPYDGSIAVHLQTSSVSNLTNRKMSKTMTHMQVYKVLTIHTVGLLELVQ